MSAQQQLPTWKQFTVYAHIEIRDEHGQLVAVVGSGQGGSPRADDSKNARLICAAHQLLAALEEARTGLKWYQDRHPESVDGSDDEAMERIESAIKAAGGSLE